MSGHTAWKTGKADAGREGDSAMSNKEMNLQWWRRLRVAIAQLDLALLGMSDDVPDFWLSRITTICTDWMRARKEAAKQLEERDGVEGDC